MIEIYYYMMLNFAFEGRIVLIVGFVQIVCKVQTYLFGKYYLVNQFAMFFRRFLERFRLWFK